MSIIQKCLNVRLAFAVHIAIVLSLAYCNAGLADVRDGSPWPLEVTPKYKPVYGDIIGVSSKDGDYIGLFDENGNCHGVGLIRGGRYFASAYRQKPPHGLVSDDYVDKGFENGDEVFFKFYKQSTGEEFDLMPHNGKKYYYMYDDSERDKLARVDLAYKRGFHVEVPPPMPPEAPISISGNGEEPIPEIEGEVASAPSSGVVRSYPTGGISFSDDEEEAAEGSEQTDKAEEKLKEIAEAILAEKGKLVAKADHEYESIDYRNRRDTSVEAGQQAPSSQTVSEASSSAADERLKSISHLTHKDDRSKEIVLAKTLSAEQADVERVPASGSNGSPLPLLLIVLGFALIVIAILLALFNRRKEEDVEKNRDI